MPGSITAMASGLRAACSATRSYKLTLAHSALGPPSPNAKQRMAFFIVHQRDQLYRLMLVGHHCYQDPAQIAHMSLNRAPVKQRGCVIQSHLRFGHPFSPRLSVRSKNCAASYPFSICEHRQAAKIKNIGTRVLPRQHRLEYRCVTQIPRWFDDLHHVFKGSSWCSWASNTRPFTRFSSSTTLPDTSTRSA